MEAKFEELGVDLTELALGGRLDPFSGREGILDEMVMVLARRTKRNPVLVGEPGVGKSALVEGLAQKIARSEVPSCLLGSRLFALDLGALMAGTRLRGDLEERLQCVLRKAIEVGKPWIVFIDEIHLLDRAGGGSESLDAASLLKPHLARRELVCVGASTPKEWQDLAERDPAFGRRFQVIPVAETCAEETLRILTGLKPLYEQHHGLCIENDVLEALALLPRSGRFSGAMPDRALDCLDVACSRLALGRGVRSEQTPIGGCAPEEACTRFDFKSLAQTRRLRQGRAPVRSVSELRLRVADLFY